MEAGAVRYLLLQCNSKRNKAITEVSSLHIRDLTWCSTWTQSLAKMAYGKSWISPCHCSETVPVLRDLKTTNSRLSSQICWRYWKPKYGKYTLKINGLHDLFLPHIYLLSFCGSCLTPLLLQPPEHLITYFQLNLSHSAAYDSSATDLITRPFLSTQIRQVLVFS